MFASFLAVANLVFVASFLFFSPTAELVAGDGSLDVGAVDVPSVRAPVVVIVFDELPATTIMSGDGTINADRYPGFAELAAVSTWFRNASSPHAHTPQAVPAVLTGKVTDGKDLPTYGDHPENLFTLLGRDVPVHRYEAVTDLCPPDICAPPPRQPLRQALEDASIVYGHRILPRELRDGLPAIDRSWGAYGSDADTTDDRPATGEELTDALYEKWRALGTEEKSIRGQARVLADSLGAITAEPSVHMVHVSLPHRPWALSRSGIALAYTPAAASNPAAQTTEFRSRLAYQLHSMQVGAVDAAIGDLVERLRAMPSWENTLLVVTADHGYSLTPPDLGRDVTERNADEVYRVPLFIKAPGQVSGEVVDDTAMTIDVLPSIVDLLDAEVDWQFDGHSLYDGSEAHTAPRVNPDVRAALEIAAARAQQFHGDDWIGLAAVGAVGDLVGRDLDELTVGPPSDLRATLDQADLLEQLPTADGTAPFVLTGTVTGEPGSVSAPGELVVAVNGTLAGVVGDFQRSGEGWKFTGYVADLYRNGRNEAHLYEVARQGDDVTLHQLTT
jgi:Sulfatase